LNFIYPSSKRNSIFVGGNNPLGAIEDLEEEEDEDDENDENEEDN
jgi:hypothetical protein